MHLHQLHCYAWQIQSVYTVPRTTNHKDGKGFPPPLTEIFNPLIHSLLMTMISSISLFTFVGLLSLIDSAVAAPATSLQKRTARTTPPSGCLTVGPSGETYTSITDALNALGTDSSDDACIFVYSGLYSEQLNIDYSGALTLYGYTPEWVSRTIWSENIY